MEITRILTKLSGNFPGYDLSIRNLWENPEKPGYFFSRWDNVILSGKTVGKKGKTLKNSPRELASHGLLSLLLRVIVSSNPLVVASGRGEVRA